MQNMRTNAYTPFITLTYISADVETAGGTKRIGTFVTRGKTPVWSFEEIIEPTFNQPLSLGVQEFASKIANFAYGFRASDETVKSLTAKINGARTPNTFLDVYALGFTNNPAAIDTLVGLAKDEQEYVRQAAISSLGNIGATGPLRPAQVHLPGSGGELAGPQHRAQGDRGPGHGRVKGLHHRGSETARQRFRQGSAGARPGSSRCISESLVPSAQRFLSAATNAGSAMKAAMSRCTPAW